MQTKKTSGRRFFRLASWGAVDVSVFYAQTKLRRKKRLSDNLFFCRSHVAQTEGVIRRLPCRGGPHPDGGPQLLAFPLHSPPDGQRGIFDSPMPMPELRQSARLDCHHQKTIVAHISSDFLNVSWGWGRLKSLHVQGGPWGFAWNPQGVPLLAH